MAQLVGLIVSEDDAFKKHFGRLLRAGAIPVSVLEDRTGRDGSPDLIIVDTRGDAASAMSSIERLRVGAARNGPGRAGVGDHARLFRGQGRRRHDDPGGELWRGGGAPQQALDPDRGSEARAGRGGAVSRDRKSVV